jgi:hypothetical protein
MRRLVPGVAAVVVAAMAFFLWPTEARAIRRALADAVDAVTGAVQISGDGPGDLAGVDDSRLTVTLTNVDGAWLIARVALVPALRR